MSSNIQKKGVLPDSSIPVSKGTRDDKGRKVKPLPPQVYDAEKQIKEYGLKPVETFEYTDPVTQEKKKFTVDRRGTTEDRVALTLLDAEATREQKDTAVSMYLFERGKQGASMLMDLWAYKGSHTKESRAFQSTMRFDFELFLSVFQTFMHDSADLIFKNLPLEVVEAEVEVDGKTVTKEIVRLTRVDVEAKDIALTLGEFARYHRMTADLIGKRIKSEVQKRERARGKGIYIDKDNKPYSIYEDDDIVEVVQKDKASLDEEKNHG
jgi:hypothetical protein